MTASTGFDPSAYVDRRLIRTSIVRIGDPVYFQYEASGEENAFLSQTTRWGQGVPPVETPAHWLEGPRVLPNAPQGHYLTDASSNPSSNPDDEPVKVALPQGRVPAEDFAQRGVRFGQELRSGESVVRLLKSWEPDGQMRFLGIFWRSAYAMYYPWPNRIEWQVIKVVDGKPAVPGTPVRYTDTVLIRNKNAADNGWPWVYLARHVDSWAIAVSDPSPETRWVIYPADGER